MSEEQKDSASKNSEQPPNWGELKFPSSQNEIGNFRWKFPLLPSPSSSIGGSLWPKIVSGPPTKATPPIFTQWVDPEKKES